MNESTTSDQGELERLRTENEDLRRKVEFFSAEHRWGAHLATLVFFGPRLTKSVHQWMARSSLKEPLPLEETSNLAAAIIRRLIAVGLLGLLIPTAPLIWQNLLIRDQNRYFREQTGELRKQIAIQEEQGDLITRKDLLEIVYDGKRAGLSMRTRVEGLKALVALDNKLIAQGRLKQPRVNVQGVDFSCDRSAKEECADISGARLMRADFTGANLKGVDFSGTDLRDSTFFSADLSDADLSRASLEGAQFRKTFYRHFYEARRPKRKPLAFGDMDNIMNIMQIGEIEDKIGLVNFDSLTDEEISLFEFAISRANLSESLTSLINHTTEAATYNVGTKIIRSGRSGDLYISSNTLLPAGATYEGNSLPHLKSRVEILERVDNIQIKADRLFGIYTVDIDRYFEDDRPDKSVHIGCSNSSDGHIRFSTLGRFEGISDGVMEERLRELCLGEGARRK